MSVRGNFTEATATWNSATPPGEELQADASAVASLVVEFSKSGQIDLGTVAFEVSSTGSRWHARQATRSDTGVRATSLQLPSAPQDTAWHVDVTGWAKFRVRLSSAITNSGSVLVTINGDDLVSRPTQGVVILDSAVGTPATVTALGELAVQANVTSVPPAVANSSPPFHGESSPVALSVDLSGHQRVNVGRWLGSNAPTTGQKAMGQSIPVVVASDQSAVTVSGPLTDAQLRAASVPVSVGAPGGDVFVASALAMSKSANKHYLSVFNAHATLKVEVVRVAVWQENTAAVTGLVRGYRLFRITAHSAGTTVTPEKRDTSQPNLNASITARSNGQNATVSGGALGGSAIYEDESGGAEGRAVMFDESLCGGPVVCNTNEGVTVQQDGTVGVGALSAQVYFRVK